MGRYVYLQDGNIDFEWKFGFASQCSNFGLVLRLLDTKIFVERFIGINGEMVILEANKNDLINGLQELLKDLTECPICQTEECFKDTQQMLQDFLQATVKCKDDYLQAMWYVEY